MSWQQKIPGAFGDQDLVFAEHPLDADRALDLLKDCYQSDIPLKDVIDEVEKYLKANGATTQHITDQLSKIREKFSGWLS